MRIAKQSSRLTLLRELFLLQQAHEQGGRPVVHGYQENKKRLRGTAREARETEENAFSVVAEGNKKGGGKKEKNKEGRGSKRDKKKDPDENQEGGAGDAIADAVDTQDENKKTRRKKASKGKPTEAATTDAEIGPDGGAAAEVDNGASADADQEADSDESSTAGGRENEKKQRRKATTDSGDENANDDQTEREGAAPAADENSFAAKWQNVRKRASEGWQSFKDSALSRLGSLYPLQIYLGSPAKLTNE
ncbi:unnamed protein product [Amoebophrya sp. A120]|nr:unnamed protein product [Amoebophrya sp. A120]|eukprot:GSA120T00009822001.1